MRRVIIGLCLGLVALAALASCQQAPVDDEPMARSELNKQVRATFKLPKIFSFERFKSAFGKRYHSSLEELVRLKLFLARSYRAFLTAVKYKHRKSGHYLAVNSRSDWTFEELEQSRNRVEFLEEDEDLEGANLRGENEEEHEELLAEPEELEEELQRIEGLSSEPGYRELAAELRKQRVKRETAPRLRNDFELDDVFERKRDNELRRDLGAQRVASNNPNYEPVDVASEMSAEELEKLPGYKETYFQEVYYGRRVRTYDHLPVKSKYTTNKFSLIAMTTSLVSNIFNWWGGSADQGEVVATKGQPDEQPDVVWVDHRQSNCMMPVQDQGRCGSCYIFAILSFFEWAHCIETGGERVKFSEQYVIDCGPKLEGLDGCNGGRITTAGLFIQNFGLELARHYPYKARDEQCPYEESAPLASMGYLRVEVPQIKRVPLQVWEEHLEVSPMVVNISPKGDFDAYGGGVFDGKDCQPKGTHSMLLIGHGREDGEEYWLIRNSYSTDYGEQGHLKLNKNSDCFHPRLGFVYGSMASGSYPSKINLHANRNAQVPEPVKKLSGKPAKVVQQSEAMRHEIELAKRREEARRKLRN